MKELAAIANEADEARLRFLIIGGLAVNAYGQPRATYDADLLIPRRDLPAWKALLDKFGYALRHEQETFVQFQPPLKGMWPVDLMLVTDGTFEKLARESRRVQIADAMRPVPSPMHLIALKLHALKHGPASRATRTWRTLLNWCAWVRLTSTPRPSPGFVRFTAQRNCKMKYENESRDGGGMELREGDVFELPMPTEPLKSWRGLVDPDAVLMFSEQQLERFWSDPEFVRRRDAEVVTVPFEMQ